MVINKENKEGEKMKDGFTLNKESADPNVNFKDYEDQFVGFEFEFRFGPNATVCTGADVAKHFGVPFEKTNGKGKRIVKQELRGSFRNGSKATFEIEVENDKYKEAGYVTDVYNDGSVPVEVVTRPVRIKELAQIKEKVFDYLNSRGVKNDCDADFFADGKGGLHMTFTNNHHSHELSRYDKSVVTNLIQLTRAFNKEIVCHFPGKGNFTRGLEYRRLQSVGDANSPGSGSRYVGINPRRDDDGNIWGIEVRIPDGTDNWDMIVNQVKFWMAMIRHASMIAKYGRLGFSDEIWKSQRDWASKYGHKNKIRVTNQPRMKQLLSIIKPSLEWFGYDKNLGVETNEKFEKALELQLAGHNLGEIAKGLGYSSGSTDMVKAILNNGGN